MSYRNLHTAARGVASCAITVSLVATLAGCGLFTRATDEPAVIESKATQTQTQTQTQTSDQSGSTPKADDGATATTDENIVYIEDVEGLGLVADEGMAMAPSEVMPYEGYDPYNTEEYNAIEEKGFVSAATSPLSTISSDVDTASYCNLRRMLRDGWTMDEIDAGAVRIEEMLNYFSYDYATPQKGADLFGLSARVGDCPWNADTKLVTLGFATSPEAASIAEAGSNLVFLIDVSGSMESADKLGLLKDSFDELVSHLGENDRVSIVTYASGEEVVLEGARGDEQRKIMRAINRLQASGSTNGEAGLKMAYELAQENFIEGGVNRIVLASDGDLNVGMSSESDLHDYVDKQRDTGIYLSVLGFGSGNYKDNKMETLADHGNGSYHYIDCVEEAERVLGEKLTANLVPLADDVKLQVEFNPALVKGYRLIGYENRAMADEDFRNDEKDAGDVGPGHQFTVAYEVALTDSKQEVAQTDLKYGQESTGNADVSEWLTATIRYQPADGSDVREQQLAVGEDDWQRDPDKDWHFQAAVVELGMLLRDSSYAGTASFDQINELLDKGGVEGSVEREGFADLADLALG